ncbi:uncharacterized protein EI90DRAFT_3037791 [Cantharellus anzutake]|uniref:uncharacterized protein n=1 Tax=Cantharellus anzutake TaxID=1750568 RepID=UPI001907927D|nr:uncharacterized protein EI90DRAFT_3037791 [Cantharellus anzutake]KAF8339796.1 hypothetical protein EI90DRAFT_3037791 [Cantharellus anzutake]
MTRQAVALCEQGQRLLFVDLELQAVKDPPHDLPQGAHDPFHRLRTRTFGVCTAETSRLRLSQTGASKLKATIPFSPFGAVTMRLVYFCSLGPPLVPESFRQMILTTPVGGLCSSRTSRAPSPSQGGILSSQSHVLCLCAVQSRTEQTGCCYVVPSGCLPWMWRVAGDRIYLRVKSHDGISCADVSFQRD